MRVYVAGATADMEPARRAMALVRDAGLEITHDWVTDVEKEGNANDFDKERATQIARTDLRALRTAHVVWVTTTEKKGDGCGLWIELGAALAYGVPVVISGPQAFRSIFAALGHRFEHESDAFCVVRREGLIDVRPK